VAKHFTPVSGRQRVDRYELVGALASGGMATVFLARLTGVGGFQRFVAIKRLHPHFANDEKVVEMFLAEGRIAARIHHPNVVPILEVGAGADGYYLVMEYIEGDTLAQLLVRARQLGQRLPVPIALRIALDTLAGLHAAHELCDDSSHPIHLVHRDVSPQNVLVGVDGIARITDFGVARATSRLTNTLEGELKGKIAYMAPEQAAGETSLDRRADVFASGIVIWEALAAKRLFKAENEAATLLRVMTEPILPLDGIVPDLSGELSHVVMRALERDQSRRFGTCAEFADALEEAATGKEGIATPRELAAFVTALIGAEVLAQRETVRAWIAHGESNQPASSSPALPPSSASSSLTMAQSSADERTANEARLGPEQPRRRTALIGTLTLLLILAAGSGFWVVRRTEKNQSRTSASSPTAPATTGIPELRSSPALASGATPATSADPSLTRPLPTAPNPTVPQRPRVAPKKSVTRTHDAVDLRNPYR
jgi:eukaryotic-like serine/threonine-protein kinase